MIEPITQERWQQAQTAEATATSYDSENSRRSYRHIFGYLGISFDHSGFITEIGCGPYPAVSFCPNAQGVIYEPLEFGPLWELPGRIAWYQGAFEDDPAPKRSDEVWLFNCLQHVRDPELLISKCKEIAPVIRYFEPVDYGTCIYHPHSFSEDDFVRWFGSVNRYTDRVPGFFDADCVYGTWRQS